MPTAVLVEHHANAAILHVSPLLLPRRYGSGRVRHSRWRVGIEVLLSRADSRSITLAYDPRSGKATDYQTQVSRFDVDNTH